MAKKQDIQDDENLDNETSCDITKFEFETDKTAWTLEFLTWRMIITKRRTLRIKILRISPVLMVLQ